jgi:Domain of unknown function (DUF4262)
MNVLANADQKLLNDIQEFGWHVVKVPGDDVGPGFGYSVGLYKSFGHPEIIIIGLKLDLIHSIINGIGEGIRSGKVFPSGQYYSGLIQGFDCYLMSVEKKYYDDYVGYAKWYYKGTDFTLTQCVYPTVKGIYPWQDEWPNEIKTLQPVLGEVF